MKTILALIFLIGAFGKSYSQKLTTVKKLSNEYQSCLDKGVGMTYCAGYFSYQMDSLLNVFYNDLREKCNTTQRVNLKKEQLAWLKKRDRQFKLNEIAARKEAKRDGFSDNVKQMFLYHKNAATVKKRVIALAKAKPTNYSAK